MQLEKLRSELRQKATWVNPQEIQHKKLQNMVNDLYRPEAKFGSGSTADAARIELHNTNIKVSGRDHIRKIERDYLPGLDNLLNNHELTAHDRMIAENVRLDLLDAIGKKLWYTATTIPKS